MKPSKVERASMNKIGAVIKGVEKECTLNKKDIENIIKFMLHEGDDYMKRAVVHSEERWDSIKNQILAPFSKPKKNVFLRF